MKNCWLPGACCSSPSQKAQLPEGRQAVWYSTRSAGQHSSCGPQGAAHTTHDAPNSCVFWGHRGCLLVALERTTGLALESFSASSISHFVYASVAISKYLVSSCSRTLFNILGISVRKSKGMSFEAGLGIGVLSNKAVGWL